MAGINWFVALSLLLSPFWSLKIGLKGKTGVENETAYGCIKTSKGRGGGLSSEQ